MGGGGVLLLRNEGKFWYNAPLLLLPCGWLLLFPGGLWLFTGGLWMIAVISWRFLGPFHLPTTFFLL